MKYKNKHKRMEIPDGFWDKGRRLLSLIQKETLPYDEKEEAVTLAEFMSMDAYIVAFRSTDSAGLPKEASPKGYSLFFELFARETGELQSGNDYLGGCSMFRPEFDGTHWTGSFLTNLPDRLRYEIDKSSTLSFVSMMKADGNKIISHMLTPYPDTAQDHAFWDMLERAYDLLKQEPSSREEDRLNDLLDYLAIDGYLITYRVSGDAVDRFQKEQESGNDTVLAMYTDRIGLYCGNGYFGGSSVFLPMKRGDVWEVSFLSNIPERVRHEITKDADFEYVSSRKLDRELLRNHLQEALAF
ncbi:MAG: hypothetical protein ACOCWH_00075 [Spirochaetota bacterium]